MNLGTGRAEIEARGYSRFTDARLNAWGNAAKNRFEDYQFDWPWLWATTTGTAPLTISDVRRVLTVVDSTNQLPLTRVSRESLVDFFDTNLSLAGPPMGWYLSSETQVSTYPTSGASLSVRYVKFSPELASDSDSPLIPVRYHYAWVDLWEVEVLRFGVKDTNAAAALEQSVLGRLNEIAGVYAMQGMPANDETLVTGASFDG